MTCYALGDVKPQLGAGAYVAPGAHVIGDVTLAASTSVWFCAVLRGDNEPIQIGEGSNIQEHAMLHTDPGFPLIVSKNCTIGHGAIVHGCTVGDNCLIGMGATILNGAVIGDNCLIGAGALVTEGKEIPAGSLVLGAPARVVRDLDDDAKAGLLKSAETYQKNAARFLKDLKAEG